MYTRKHVGPCNVSGKIICSAPGCLKSREGNIIMEKEKILKDGQNILVNSITMKEAINHRL